MRLIDADALIKRFEVLRDEHETHSISYDALYVVLLQQPTAYSVEKVVEELENEAERWEDSGKEYKDKCEIAVGRGLRNSIEIVNHGDVSDDVCEWEYVDAYSYYKVGCKENIVPIQYGDYCPYCGKKIKVVE